MGKVKSQSGCLGASLGCAAVVGIAFLFFCGGAGWFIYIIGDAASKVAESNFADAEKLYDSGEIPQAIEKYKLAYTLTIDRDKRKRIVERVLPEEFENGRNSEGTIYWADEALENNVSFDDKAIQDLIDERSKLRQERFEQWQAERDKKKAQNKLEVDTMVRRPGDLKRFFEHPSTVKVDWVPRSWFLENGGIAYTGTVTAKNSFNLEVEEGYRLEYSALGELVYVEIGGEVLVGSK